MNISTGVFVITFFFALVLSLFVLFNNHKNPVNRFFCLLGFSLALWVLSNVLVNLTYSQDNSLIFVRIAIIWVALLPIFFNLFLKHLFFLENVEYIKESKIFLRASYVVTFGIVLFSQTSLNVKGVTLESWGVNYQPGPLYLVLLCYLLIAFGFSFFYLYKISKEPPNLRGTQAKFILVGASVTLIFSLFTNIFFPFLGYGFANIFGPSSVLIFLSFIAYSITRHRLFNIKILAIEIVTFGLWITILIRIFLAKTEKEMLMEIGFLGITVIFGIMLIRSVLHEIRQREYIETLAHDLRKAYSMLKNLNGGHEQK